MLVRSKTAVSAMRSRKFQKAAEHREAGITQAWSVPQVLESIVSVGSS